MMIFDKLKSIDMNYVFFIFVVSSGFGFNCKTIIHKRVIGGEEAPPDQYRWAVSLKGDVDELKVSGSCGASILNTNGTKQWLITAAHCFYPSNGVKVFDLTKPDLWHARVGLRKVDFYYEKHGNQIKSKLVEFFQTAFTRLFQNKKSDTTTGDIHIKKIYIHPDYKPSRLENDIALMKLINPLPVEQLKGDNVIELPNMSLNANWPEIDSECVVVGWGCTKAAGRPNLVAKLAKLKVWNNKKCQEAFISPIDLNPVSEFCAGYRKKTYGLCQGDSGSGLACKQNDDWTIAGVVSAAHSKQPEEYPALFTRVSSFRSWMFNIINKN